MCATCRAAVANKSPHAAGSLKLRRSASAKLSPTIAARITSMPFSLRAAGGIPREADGFLLMSSPVATSLGRRDHLGDGWQREFFQVRRIGHRHVLAAHPRHRRVEIVKSVFHHERGDFGADARLLPALLDRDDAPGLFDRGDDGFRVHGTYRAQIDHFGSNVFLGEFVGRLERIAHAHGPRDERYVAAWSMGMSYAL